MSNIIRAVRLLANNAAEDAAVIPPPTRLRTPDGVEYDLYSPVQLPVATYILLYGLDLAGEKDSRMIRFAAACASAGLRAAVPDLPGLKSYRFDSHDLQVVACLAAELHRKFNSPIGTIGFSAGGSYALAVAAECEAAWLDPLLLFTPYYSLEGDPPLRRPPVPEQLDNERDWAHFIWCQFVIAYRRLEDSDFSPSERQELLAMLWDCCNTPLEPKLALYRRLFHDRPPADIMEDIFAGQDLSPFSLRGKLRRVKGRVYILHDPYDDLIPPEHSQRMLAELQRRPPPATQDLLVTDLISHVMPQYHLRLSQGLKAILMLSQLFPR